MRFEYPVESASLNAPLVSMPSALEGQQCGNGERVINEYLIVRMRASLWCSLQSIFCVNVPSR